jgi:hypothetical protein
MSNRIFFSRVSLAVVWVLAIVAIAEACNVPVFRFALERWRADAYRVTVFHEGPLSAADQEVLIALEEQHEKMLANVSVRTLDVAELEGADQELLEALKSPKFPQLVVQYPPALRINVPVWSQAFDAAATKQLLDSPLRKDLLNRLLDGETAVWLLVECSDADKNEAAENLLNVQLKKLTSELKLPELTDLPDDNLVAKTPLKISFSVLRVPRGEAESPLVQMLLHSESDLLERDDPMVFPVFGRGRALLPLIGAGITADNVSSSASFLVGACSCEVKELNPGFDLLLSADWDQLLSPDGVPLPIVKTRNLPEGPPELIPIPSGSNTSAAVNPAPVNSAASPIAAVSSGSPQNRTGFYTIIAIVGVLVTIVVLANLNQKSA